MSNEKQIKSRIQQKMDTSANWKIAGEKGFVPLKGEIIVYSDLGKMKIGDGDKNINELVFTKSQNVQVVEADENTASHTYQDIKDFVDQGDTVVLKDNENHLYNLVKIDDSTVSFSCIEDNYLYSYWIHRDGINLVENGNVQLYTFDDTAPNLIVTIEDEISSNQAGEIAGYASGGANVILIDESRVYHLDYVDQENFDPGMVIFSSIDNEDNIIFKIKIEGIEVTRWTLEWSNDQSGVQSDWEEADENADSFIQNKPAIRAGEAIDSIVEGSSSNSAVGNYSHAEGMDTEAQGDYSHAEGSGNQAYGDCSHAEGCYTHAIGSNSHAEGHDTRAVGGVSHAEGESTHSEGYASHSEGDTTHAIGDFSHAEGYWTKAVGEDSHAEGEKTYTFGRGAHAEGYYNFTSISWRLSTTDPERKIWKAGSLGTATVGDFVEYDDFFFKIEAISNTDKTVTFSTSIPGTTTTNVAFRYYGKIGAYGDYSHTEGRDTNAIGSNSHAEGSMTRATGAHSHAEGEYSEASGYVSHAEGNETFATGVYSHSEGDQSAASGYASHAEGGGVARGDFSHAEGAGTTNGRLSHAEGTGKTQGDYSHAEGENAHSFGCASHAEGGYDVLPDNLQLSNPQDNGKIWTYGEVRTLFEVGDIIEYYGDFYKISIIDASNKTITFDKIIPISSSTTAITIKYYGKTGAYGDYSHVEGYNTRARGLASHAEGSYTFACGDYSHAQGDSTQANGHGSHAEGDTTLADGQYSHVEGGSTIANGEYSHVQGTFNILDTSITEENPKGTYAHIVGNGSSEENRSNAHAIDWSGNAYFSGDVYTGVTSDEYDGTEFLNVSDKKLATEKYVGDNYLNLKGGTIESVADFSGAYSTAPLTIKGGEDRSLIKFLTRNNGEGSIGIVSGFGEQPRFTNSLGMTYDLGAYTQGFETVAQNSPFNSMSWYYRKWIDGTIEIWGTYSMTITSNLWVEDKSQGINLGLVSLCPYRVNGHMVLKLPKDIEIVEGFIPRVEIATLQVNEEGWRPVTIMQRRTDDVTANTTLAYNFSTYFGSGAKDVPISVNFYIRW